MTRISRRRTLGLLGATALAGCAPAIPVAQLGDDPFEGGIGGTGIVGLMTGSGSVLINGLRVETPSTTRIVANGRITTDSALIPGTAMSIVARTHLGRIEAQYIEIDTPLIGTLAHGHAGFSVNGSPLHGGGHARALVGHRVNASGLWQRDGSLRVGTLHPAAAGSDSISGVLVATGDTGWRIGQTPVRVPADLRLTPGSFAVATGQFTGGVLTAASMRVGRFRVGGRTLRQLSVEGYLEPITAAPGYRVSGLGHSFDQRLALDPFAQARAVYFGPYDGRFRAQRAVVLPENAGLRRALLQPASGAPFSAGLTGDAARLITTR